MAGILQPIFDYLGGLLSSHEDKNDMPEAIEDAVQFDSLEAVRAAFALGEVKFKCALCGKEHLSSSSEARDCLYVLNSLVTNGPCHSVLFPQPPPWKIWGHEEEFKKLAAAVGKDYMKGLRLSSSFYTVAHLALEKEKFHDLLCSHVMPNVEQENQRLLRIIGRTSGRHEIVKRYFEFCKPGPPLLPLPVRLVRVEKKKDPLSLEIHAELHDGSGGTRVLPPNEITLVWCYLVHMHSAAYDLSWPSINGVNERYLREFMFLDNGIYVLAVRPLDTVSLLGKNLYYVMLHWVDDYRLIEPVLLRYMDYMPNLEEAIELSRNICAATHPNS